MLLCQTEDTYIKISQRTAEIKFTKANGLSDQEREAWDLPLDALNCLLILRSIFCIVIMYYIYILLCIMYFYIVK